MTSAVDSALLRPAGSRPVRVRLSTISPFRYPGGKSWLRGKILKWLATLGYRPSVFVEPFAGGGSIGLMVAELHLADRVVLVERDPDVAAVWKTILGARKDELAARIRSFQMGRGRVMKILRSQGGDMVARAFRCLLRNRVQRGGILAPRAGLLRQGERGRGLRSRWYPKTLETRISLIHDLRNRIEFIEGDALDLLPEFQEKSDSAFFVDPPYTANGRGPGFRLYRFAEIDHEKLFAVLAQLRGACLVSYHPAAPVKRLGERYGFTASTTGMRTTHHRHRRELLFLKAPHTHHRRDAVGKPKFNLKSSSFASGD